MIWDINEVKEQARKAVDMGCPKAIQETDGCITYKAYDFGEASPLESDWYEMVEWGEHSFRRVWVSREYMSIFTYCEGDVILELFSKEEKFLEELGNCVKYYQLEGN